MARSTSIALRFSLLFTFSITSTLSLASAHNSPPGWWIDLATDRISSIDELQSALHVVNGDPKAKGQFDVSGVRASPKSESSSMVRLVGNITLSAGSEQNVLASSDPLILGIDLNGDGFVNGDEPRLAPIRRENVSGGKIASGTSVVHLQISCPCQGVGRVCNHTASYQLSIVDRATSQVLWGPEGVVGFMGNSCEFPTVIGKTAPIPASVAARKLDELQMRVVCGTNCGYVQHVPIYSFGVEQGQVGPTGPAGPQGSPGATGQAGPQGLPGTPGQVGASGPAGAIGPQGLPGAMGPAGSPGTPGQAGATGPAGVMGPKGEMGAIGPAGATGPQGSPGATGSAGQMGPKGEMGPSGATGATGPMGPKGDTGLAGPTGPMGLKGDTGLPGPMGLKGDTGAPGSAGSMGPQGLPGTNGLAGLQGLPGPQGSPGATGSPGPQGLPGTQGLPGATGLPGPMGPKGDPGSADIRISEVEGSILFQTPQYRGETLATKTITDLLALKSDTGHHHDIAELNAIPTCASNPTAVLCRNGSVMYLAGIPFSPASTINGRVVSHEVVTGMRLTTNSGAGFSQIGTFDLLGRQLVSYVATVIAPDGSSIVANTSSQFLLRMVGGRVLASHNNINLNGQEVVLTAELAPMTLKGIATTQGGVGGKNGL